ncbi:uncharacterized protein GGS22DRAFT_151987 [Annulohypoxylon maeteangense]|uniref:uncharacterized protein n=1 Tax=Annulohypoxylon maeteangense TaxID=1927788 RepID=UPI002008C23A|nr:uncharacterized protein GGS22DRAFT_151987 [Annulohypoxylon maeteangense]KAI0888622.1 hypothetical protein GGS22DRAFT_151987 [Annulohypoxylon maeteangense]
MSLSGSPPRPLSAGNDISTKAHQGSVSSNQAEQKQPERLVEVRISLFLRDKTEYQIIPFDEDREKKIRYEIDEFSRHFFGPPRTAPPSLSPEPKSLATVNCARYYEDLVADPTEFAYHWENKVVPHLIQSILKHSDVLSVDVVRASTEDKTNVIFLTRSKLADSRKNALRAIVQEALPESLGNTLNFYFPQGTIMAAQRPPDDLFCEAKNPFWHQKPMMGDSVGVSCEGSDYEEAGGTLGLLLQIDEKGYWVVNCHILPDTVGSLDPDKIKLRQPSVPDYTDYMDTYEPQHRPGFNFLGTPTSRSGEPYMTTRKSLHPFSEKDVHYVVTDWAAFEAQGIHNNQMRITDREDAENNYIRSSSRVVPGARVKVSGRTSGSTKASISLVPSIVLSGSENFMQRDDGFFLVKHGNGTEMVTREWAICHAYERSYETFVTDGAGAPGDSGSPIIDAGNQKYYGLLWGRNEYSNCEIIDGANQLQGTEHIPRISYFTACDDLFDDIQEKMGSQQRPKLPNIAEIRRPSGPRRSSAAIHSKPKRSIPESIRNMLSVASSPTNTVLHAPTALPVRAV